MKNEKGFTLIELLIAMGISVILLGAATYTYTKQDALLRNENANLKLRDFARMAMDQLESDLRMAGNGFPPGGSSPSSPDCSGPDPNPARGVSNADVTTITFMANTDGVSTNASFDFSSSLSNGFFVPLGSAADFAVGDDVVFFEAENPCKWNAYPISSISTVVVGPTTYDNIGWSGGNKNDFPFEPIEDGVAVLLNKYHTYTFAYDAGNKWITQSIDGGGAVTVATKVSSLIFRYFDANNTELTRPLDATDLGNLRRIQIMLIVEDDDDNTITATLMTDVNLRNMGT